MHIDLHMSSVRCIFFFSSRRRHTRFKCDWSSDVCSSDLTLQALMHARALKQLAGQFSPETLQSLDSEARAKWRAMLVEHARAFERETGGLRRELEPVFFPNGAGGEGSVEVEVGSDSDLLLAATRLFEQASAHERTISRAFSNSAGGPVMTPIRSDQFRRSLRSAEMLAEKIVRRP